MSIPLTPAQQAYRSLTSASSPLLQLPQEIKDQIYSYVHIPETIHIYQHNNALCHRRCQQTPGSPTKQRTELARLFGATVPYDKGPTFHKNWCTRTTTTLKLDLRVLDTCFQINTEARRVLYNNTTFSFSSWTILDNFVKHTPQRSLSHIRSIRLEVNCVTNFQLSFWNQTLVSAARVLTGLTAIRLDLIRWRNVAGAMVNERVLVTGLSSLALLPLKEVAIFFYEDDLDGGDLSADWSREGKEQLATWVRCQLLHRAWSDTEVDE